MFIDPNNPPIKQRILTEQVVNEGWPYQVIVPAYLCTGKQFYEQRKFCDMRGFDLCGRVGSALINEIAYRVFCFAEKRHAQAFGQAFGGIRCLPSRRGT